MSLKILYVEDDKQVSQLVQESLTAGGWTVEAAEDGLTAFSKLEGHDPYDLVLTDYEMSGLNGIKMVSRTRQISHRQEVPLILYSGSLVEAEELAADTNALLRKLEDISYIAERISQLLGSTSKTDSLIKSKAKNYQRQ